MSHQKNISDFFSLAKERPKQETSKEKDQPSGKYIPMTSGYKNKEPSPQRQTNNKYYEQKTISQPKDTVYSNVNLEECRTYALPFHIPRIWKIVRPKLINMRDGNITNIFKFCDEIHEFIQSHYSNNLRNLNLQVLKTFFEGLSSEELKYFFSKLLPFLARLALEVESLFKDPLMILKQGSSSIVNLTKRQVACLVTHMFFCTLHKQNSTQLKSDCNFTNLYRDSRKSKVKLEKLKCVYNYFKRIQASCPEEIITYERLVLKPKIQGTLNLEFWLKSQKPLKKCIIKAHGSIEDEEGAIHVDFANRMIGGGVLDGGCVQEEIRFLISPELLVSLVFTEHLLDHEAVLITGTEIYCKYSGYSETFKFAGNVQDKTKPDLFGRKDSNVLAIDAIDFSRTSTTKTQFKKERILREINKAYIGFWGSNSERETFQERKIISTGRWGCGAFQGDSHLKLILQWLAASQADRDMIFYKFDDNKLDGAERIIKLFKDSTVGELFDRIDKYNEFLFSAENVGSMDLFEFLRDVDI